MTKKIKKEPTKRNDWVYCDEKGHRIHYYPDGYYPNSYEIVGKSETQSENSYGTTNILKMKSTDPIQDAIEKDKENLDQILDENTSEEILTLANTVSRTTPHPTKNDSPHNETNAPEVSTQIEDLTSEASNLDQKDDALIQPKSKSIVGEAIDTIRNNSETAVVKQNGRHLVIKATLKGDEQ